MHVHGFMCRKLRPLHVRGRLPAMRPSRSRGDQEVPGLQSRGVCALDVSGADFLGLGKHLEVKWPQSWPQDRKIITTVETQRSMDMWTHVDTCGHYVLGRPPLSFASEGRSTSMRARAAGC